MSYRNRTGLCGLLIGCSLALASACGGLDKVTINVTPDGDNGGTGDSSNGGGSSNAGHPGGGNQTGGGDTSSSGASDSSGAGGEAGETSVPNPIPGAPPTVIAVSPKDKTVGVDVASLVKISFSEPLDPTTVTVDSVQLKDDTGAVVSGGVTYEDAVATFHPAARLSLLGNYTVSVSTDVTDTDKTPLAAPFSSTFSVRDGVWGKAETSITTNTGTFHLSSSMSLSTDGAGHAIAVWSQVNAAGGTTYDVNASIFTEGTGWGPTVKVNTHVSNSEYPTVSMNAKGDAIAGWLEFDSTLGQSVNARRYVAGTWDAAQTRIDLPSTPVQLPEKLAVAMTAKGEAHVVWSWYYYDSTALIDYDGAAARHADANGVWDATTPYLTYAQTGYGMSPLSLAFDAAGNGFAAYQFDSGTKTNTIVERYIAATGKWGASAVASTADDGSAIPVILATSPAGEAVLAWERNTGSTTYDLLASHFNKAWSAPAVISSATTSFADVNDAIGSATWTGSSFLVAWAQSAGTPNDIYASEYKTSWGTAAIVSDGNHSAGYPQLTADGRGNALAVWSQQSDTPTTGNVTPTDIVFSRLTGAADKWSDPARVSSLVAGARFPEVVTLGDGSAVSVWQTATHLGKSSAVVGEFQNGFQ